jgi:hypothetical protein
MTETKHMTFDELMKVYDKAASNVAFLQYEGPDHRAGIRAVVTALRDEFDKNGSVTWTLHQILASDGMKSEGSECVTHGQ